MKSTGLFGKNSGRVGGVVYSNYRGEQVVRTYQPKVNNPSTKRQVEQRAKFKLVSQVSASLSREIKQSFIPSVAKETPRNAFVKEMLKKTTYSNNKASLPIEDIVLTNSRETAVFYVNATSSNITGLVSPTLEDPKVRIVFIGYNDGGEVDLIGSTEAVIDGSQFTAPSVLATGYTNVRALVYAYTIDLSAGSTYEDYEVLDEEATLNDVLRVFSGRVKFYETENIAVPQNV